MLGLQKICHIFRYIIYRRKYILIVKQYKKPIVIYLIVNKIRCCCIPAVTVSESALEIVLLYFRQFVTDIRAFTVYRNIYTHAKEGSLKIIIEHVIRTDILEITTTGGMLENQKVEYKSFCEFLLFCFSLCRDFCLGIKLLFP